MQFAGPFLSPLVPQRDWKVDAASMPIFTNDQVSSKKAESVWARAEVQVQLTPKPLL